VRRTQTASGMGRLHPIAHVPPGMSPNANLDLRYAGRVRRTA
jgi:hypothetical protein